MEKVTINFRKTDSGYCAGCSLFPGWVVASKGNFYNLQNEVKESLNFYLYFARLDGDEYPSVFDGNYELFYVCDCNESYPASNFHYWKIKYGLSHPYTKHHKPTDDSFIPLDINHAPAISTLSSGDNHVTIELPSYIKIHLNGLSNPEVI